MQKTMGSLFPFGNMEEVSRQNIAMMERAFSMFTPFYRPGESGSSNPAPDTTPQEIALLRDEVERLRRELAGAKDPKS